MKRIILIGLLLILPLVSAAFTNPNTTASVTNVAPSIVSVKTFLNYTSVTNNTPGDYYYIHKNPEVRVQVNVTDRNGAPDIENVTVKVVYVQNVSGVVSNETLFPRWGDSYSLLLNFEQQEGILNRVYQGSFNMTENDRRRIGPEEYYRILVSVTDGEATTESNFTANATTIADYRFNSSVTALDYFACLNFTANVPAAIYAEESNISITVLTNGNFTCENITLLTMSENPENATRPSENGFRWIRVLASDGLNAVLDLAWFNFTYKEVELANNNIPDENTILWYFWNETTGAWSVKPTDVNSTADRVRANTTHFSTFAAFGAKPTGQGGTILGGGGGGGGGGGSYVRTIIPTASGTSVSMGQNEPFRMTVNSGTYNIKIFRVYKAAAQLLFNNLLYTLDKDQKIYLDVDGDGTKDVSVQLTNTLFSRAFMTFTLSSGISEAPPAMPITSPSTSTTSSASTDEVQEAETTTPVESEDKEETAETAPKTEEKAEDKQVESTAKLTPGASIALTLVVLLLLIGGVYLVLNWDSLFGRS